MLAVQDLEIRVGARLLMEDVAFRVDKGDKIGLVGRNGAGKTTLTKTLAGEQKPDGGTITRTGEIGYLPQDPRSGNLDDTARTRILDARGLGRIVLQLQQSTLDMASTDAAVSEAGMAAYSKLEDRFLALGGYAAEAEAAAIASNLALPDRILDQPLKTLSRRPAAAHRARAHPVLGCRHDDPRRADQPPRRGQRGVAARVPEDLRRRRHRDQPRRRPDRRCRQQGVLPRREPPGHRHLQHGLEALPAPARGRRGPPQEGARRTSRRRRPRCSCRRHDSARRRRRRPPPIRWWRGPRRCSPGSTTCASPTGSPSCASPTRWRADALR